MREQKQNGTATSFLDEGWIVKSVPWLGKEEIFRNFSQTWCIS